MSVSRTKSSISNEMDLCVNTCCVRHYLANELAQLRKLSTLLVGLSLQSLASSKYNVQIVFNMTTRIMTITFITVLAHVRYTVLVCVQKWKKKVIYHELSGRYY